MKLAGVDAYMVAPAQPPSGGCELKPFVAVGYDVGKTQPPSGGCELKPKLENALGIIKLPAAFGRL